jgi:hypothetical protein
VTIGNGVSVGGNVAVGGGGGVSVGVCEAVGVQVGGRMNIAVGVSVGSLTAAGSVGGGNGLKPILGLAKIAAKAAIRQIVVSSVPRVRRFQITAKIRRLDLLCSM